jgi:hypothetical protein
MRFILRPFQPSRKRQVADAFGRGVALIAIFAIGPIELTSDTFRVSWSNCLLKVMDFLSQLKG